jgi:hypothetical protein
VKFFSLLRLVCPPAQAGVSKFKSQKGAKIFRSPTCADPVPSALLFSFSVLPTKEGNCRSPSAGVFEPNLINCSCE